MLSSIPARLRIVLSWFCWLFLISSNVPHIAAAQSAADDAAIRKLVEKFFDFYQKGELDGLMALWSEKSPDLLISKQEFGKVFAGKRIQLNGLTIRKIDVRIGEATARSTAEVSAEDLKTGKAADGFGIMNRTFHLLREGDVWKIWRFARSEQELAAALMSAKTEQGRETLLAAERDLVTSDLVLALLSHGVQFENRSAYSNALECYKLAERIAEQLQDQVGVAHALRSIGIVHRSQGNYTEALENYERSLEISERLGDKNGTAATLTNLGNVHRNQGNYVLALERYHKSLKIRRETGDERGINGVLSAIAAVHTAQGQYNQALEYFDQSLKIAEKRDDKQGIANIMGNIGNIHSSRGDQMLALDSYQKALKVSQEIRDRGMIATCLGNIGVVHKSLGNFTQALTHYKASMELNEQMGNKVGIAIALHNIASLQEAQGNHNQALDLYSKSLKISQDIGDKLGISITLNNIGNVHHAQLNYSLALEHYQKSLKISEEIDDKKGIAIRLNNIGKIIEDSQGDYTQAIEYYRKSLRIRQEIQDKSGIASALNNIGRVYHSRGDYAQALEHYTNSLTISRQIGDRHQIARTLANIGSVHYSQGNFTPAREALVGAIAAVEELRNEIVGDEQQHQQFFKTKLSPYHQMIRLLIDEEKYAVAFEFAERVKGRALLDTLQSGRADVTKSMTESERTDEQRLRGEIIVLNNQISNENRRKQPDKAVLADLEARREKARMNHEAFLINLYAAHPELKIQRGEMKPISMDGAAKLIPNAGTAILEYVVTEDKTYLFVLTGEQQSHAKHESSAGAPVLNVYTIKEKQKSLADRVSRFRSRLMQKDVEFAESARDLYDLLIGPARVHLKNKTNLIIVPDAALWQVPFQTLQPSVNRFLIQDYTTSYASSLTVLHEMMNLTQKRRAASTGLSTLLAFGNPDVDPTTATALQALYTEVLANEKLVPLPQTEKLVNTLNRLYGPERSKIYVGAEAREDRLKKEAGTCRILQFATHAIADNTNPLYSRLVMSQSGVNEQEDGMLEAWEIMRLNLNVEMAVLSACETAQGRVAGGEGMIGLAWAFFVAGCPTTVVSQWPVEVNSTTELMIEFHKNLKPAIEGRSSNVSKADALRAAALKLMKNRRYRHPFYWAPFVVIGDGR